LVVVPGSLGVYVGIDRVRDGGISAAGFVLVDERSAFAAMAHPGHQIAPACTTGCRKGGQDREAAWGSRVQARAEVLGWVPDQR
jgi:hypothetical protein